VVAILLLLAAGAIGIAGVRAFGRARTTVDPLRPEKASSLVTAGIYRRTRNPMYVALAIALLAWAVWLAHPLTLLGVAAFVAWISRFQIAPEERALHALFGAEFDRYCSEVRRWL
jgi:protein-S-isoprenylcysteine O-methyltransferase Ste14